MEIGSEFSETIIPAGSYGVVVECYTDPEGYAIDFEIPDDALVGGFRYENVILFADQFDD